MHQIEQGAAGLFYLIDPDNRTLFIVAGSEQEAEQFATLAEQGAEVPRHTLHDYAAGAQLLIPDPQKTPEQETIDRMKNHLRDRFVS